jgi:hypothetical protein
LEKSFFRNIWNPWSLALAIGVCGTAKDFFNVIYQYQGG